MISKYKVDLYVKKQQNIEHLKFEVTSFVVNPMSENIIFFMKDENTNSVVNTSLSFGVIDEIKILTMKNEVIYERVSETNETA